MVRKGGKENRHIDAHKLALLIISIETERCKKCSASDWREILLVEGGRYTSHAPANTN